METKIKRVFTISLWSIGAILLSLIIISWFVDYPTWLNQLLSNILLVGLGIVMLYKAFQIRNMDSKFASIYLIVGVILILVAFLSLTFVKIIAVVGLALFLLTNRRVQNIINKKEETRN